MDLISRLASYGFLGFVILICVALLFVGGLGVTLRRRRTA